MSLMNLCHFPFNPAFGNSQTLILIIQTHTGFLRIRHNYMIISCIKHSNNTLDLLLDSNLHTSLFCLQKLDLKTSVMVYELLLK